MYFRTARKRGSHETAWHQCAIAHCVSPPTSYRYSQLVPCCLVNRGAWACPEILVRKLGSRRIKPVNPSISNHTAIGPPTGIGIREVNMVVVEPWINHDWIHEATSVPKIVLIHRTGVWAVPRKSKLHGRIKNNYTCTHVYANYCSKGPCGHYTHWRPLSPSKSLLNWRQSSPFLRILLILRNRVEVIGLYIATSLE